MSAVWFAGLSGIAHAVDGDTTVVDGWAATLCRPRGRRALTLDSVGDLPRCQNCVAALNRSCGTYAGYMHHVKVGRDEPCEPCREARNEYARERRQRNPKVREKVYRENAARTRAAWRLVHEYPDRFRQLVNEELADV